MDVQKPEKTVPLQHVKHPQPNHVTQPQHKHVMQAHKDVSSNMQAVNNFDDGKGNFQFFTILKNPDPEENEVQDFSGTVPTKSTAWSPER